MKKIFLCLAICLFSLNIYSAARVELRCKIPPPEMSFIDQVKGYFSSSEPKESNYVVVGKGLREGHTKYSSKNNQPQWKIYFDLKAEKFISSQSKEDHLIDLLNFTSGVVTLPKCRGAVIEYVKAGFVD